MQRRSITVNNHEDAISFLSTQINLRSV